MNPQNYPPPTEHEWAQAEVQVIKVGEPPIIGLRKSVRKNGQPYTQTIWLTLTPLRGLAIEETL